MADKHTDKTGAWWDAYRIYLASDAWKARRQLVLERENYICQGCRQRRATHAHHTTYTHVGNELLYQLIALCRACHDKAHNR